jgi:hypothetical protein
VVHGGLSGRAGDGGVIQVGNRRRQGRESAEALCDATAEVARDVHPDGFAVHGQVDLFGGRSQHLTGRAIEADNPCRVREGGAGRALATEDVAAAAIGLVGDRDHLLADFAQLGREGFAL